MYILNNLEKLEEIVSENNIDVIEDYHFESARIKGLYCNKVIAMSEKLQTLKEKSCVLAEELGHFYTSTGTIIDMKYTQNRKQELRARMWAYNKEIGLQGIISAHKARCMNMHDIADYLNVTEDFFKEAIECYRNKYGMATKVDNYVVGFEPTLYVMEMFEGI